jgi:hypothetical protein
VSRPPAPRNAGIIIGGSGQSFNDDDEQTDDVEDLDNIDGFPVSQGTRAYWSDENNACLFDLAIEQRRTGMACRAMAKWPSSPRYKGNL